MQATRQNKQCWVQKRTECTKDTKGNSGTYIHRFVRAFKKLRNLAAKLEPRAPCIG